MEKIFEHTREELVEMFEPLSQSEEMVNEITMKETNCGKMTSTAEYKKNMVLWTQNIIENSRMSKKDKNVLYTMIGGIMNTCYNAGFVEGIKGYGHFDEYVAEQAKANIEEFKKLKAERNWK